MIVNPYYKFMVFSVQDHFWKMAFGIAEERKTTIRKPNASDPMFLKQIEPRKNPQILSMKYSLVHDGIEVMVYKNNPLIYLGSIYNPLYNGYIGDYTTQVYIYIYLKYNPTNQAFFSLLHSWPTFHPLRPGRRPCLTVQSVAQAKNLTRLAEAFIRRKWEERWVFLQKWVSP